MFRFAGNNYKYYVVQTQKQMVAVVECAAVEYMEHW